MTDYLSDAEILTEWVELAGCRAVDIGCGGGDMVRFMRSRGARPMGIEYAAEPLARALAADHGHRGTYLRAAAQALPLGEAGFDLVTFYHSLHHVPEPAMGQALAEAARVLVAGGHVLVAEPKAGGNSLPVDRLVDDETEVYAAAQATLRTVESVGLRQIARRDYAESYHYPDFAAYRTTMVGVDAGRAARFDANRSEIEAAFHRHGRTTGSGKVFDQPCQAVLLQKS